MWHQKWARHTGPFLEPMGAISVAVPKQGSMELGGQNWVPQTHKLRPKIGANFWALLLTPFAYRVMLRFQNTLIQRARLKQYCFNYQISMALRPSRPASGPASKPALKCFVLISMVSRHWSSRLALRPASNCVSSYNFAAISITLKPRGLPGGRSFAPAKFPARQQSHQLLQVQPCWDFNNSIIVSSTREPRFVLVPIRFASQAWPRPGLAEPRSGSLAGFGFFHQHKRKGNIVMIKTSRYKARG